MFLKRLKQELPFYVDLWDDDKGVIHQASGSLIAFTGRSYHYSTSMRNYEILTSIGLCYTVQNFDDVACFEDL